MPPSAGMPSDGGTSSSSTGVRPGRRRTSTVGARQVTGGEPGADVLDGRVQVAGLGPVRVEHHRDGGDPHQVGQARQDLRVPCPVRPLCVAVRCPPRDTATTRRRAAPSGAWSPVPAKARTTRTTVAAARRGSGCRRPCGSRRAALPPPHDPFVAPATMSQGYSVSAGHRANADYHCGDADHFGCAERCAPDAATRVGEAAAPFADSRTPALSCRVHCSPGGGHASPECLPMNALMSVVLRFPQLSASWTLRCRRSDLTGSS